MKYHKDVFMPKLANLSLPLVYTSHARNAALEDRYANLTNDLPKLIDLAKVELVELDTHFDPKGREVVEKLLVRFGIGDGLDLCLVILVTNEGYLVKTVWANESNDMHLTLRNRSQYETGPARKPQQ